MRLRESADNLCEAKMLKVEFLISDEPFHDGDETTMSPDSLDAFMSR